jgi:hypothetical protein
MRDRREILAGLASWAIPVPPALNNRADPVRLGRGLNIYKAADEELMDASAAADRIARTAEEDLPWIAAAGFDFTRLCVNPELFLTGSRGAPHMRGALAQYVNRAGGLGLRTVVDLHPTVGPRRVSGRQWLEFEAGRPGGRRQYVELLASVAALLAPHAPNSLLELMNEPPAWRLFERAAWPGLVRAQYKAVRHAAPTLPCVVSGASGSLAGLLELPSFPDDRGIVYTFHYYEPKSFTHQSLSWDPDFRGTGVVAWPPGGLAGAQRARAAIHSDFAKVQAWARTRGIPASHVMLGEFGAARTSFGDRHATDADRGAWLQAVRTTAEAAGFSWAVWSLDGGPFSLSSACGLERVATDALGLRQSACPLSGRARG